jgi:hypothetical protein
MKIFNRFRRQAGATPHRGGGASRLISRASGRRALILLSLAVAGVILAAVPSSSATVDPYPGVVTVYTGCLNTAGSGAGTIVSLGASATTPLKPCGSNQRTVHVAGGTLTGITAGTGLKGGGTNGTPTLSLDGNYQLPQACAAGNLPGSNGTGSGYSCYAAGTGLNSDPASKTLSLAGPYQLPQGCADGNLPGSGSSGSTWDCYTAGTGLQSDTASKTLKLAGPYQLPQGCGAGQVPGSTGPGNNYACYAPGTGLSSDTSNNTIGVNVGTGLSTDSNNNVAVAGSYQLPQGCNPGQIAKWNGTAWVCADDNPTGLNGVYVQTAFISVGSAPSTPATQATCNPGDIAISGGADLTSVEGSLKILKPIGDPPSGWIAEANVTSLDPGNDHNLVVYAVCAKSG